MQKVVYLLGAGATQAEISFQGIESLTTMRFISEGVLRMSKEGGGEFYKLNQDFSLPPEQDIEQLMSLFQGFDKRDVEFHPTYCEIRKLFRGYLLSQITDKKLRPNLLIALLHLHRNYGQFIGEDGENLLAVFTTNYDTLTDYSFKEVYGGVNLGYSFQGDTMQPNSSAPFLAKLHGAFNWEILDYELYVRSDNNIKKIEASNEGWLPPSVFKKPELDLYKAIWAKAKKVLNECHVLRVVGCSLRNEDISLLSLIFRAQLKLKNRAFRIEFIDFEDFIKGNDGQTGLIQRLPFLIKPKSYKELNIYDPDVDDGKNPFYSWLKMLTNHISKNNSDILEDEVLINNLKLE